MNILLLWIGKVITLVSKISGRGAGSTWPGHIALESNPNFIKEILKKNKHIQIILIAGTNGKTTTTTLLKHLLTKNGYKVFQNNSGANLLNGIASSMIQASNMSGKFMFDVALFETDENTLPLVLKELTPQKIILLNLFRDQLDRYGEVNSIAKHWKIALSELPKKTELYVNGDDPQLTYMGEESGLQTHYFGISEERMEKKDIPHDVDFLYCPKCNTKLEFTKMSYSHMGLFSCPNCHFKRPLIEGFQDLAYPLFGTYNIYNTNAACLVAYDFGIPLESVKLALNDFKPAFGRQEEIIYKGKKIIILLSKNPAGFNQSIDAVSTYPGNHTVLLVLNDKIPDGRDVSWIWDVDFENLNASHITVSGDRTFDMALRIQYAEKEFETEEALEKALAKAIHNTKENETLFVLATYSGMLEIRKLITGKEIL